MSQNIETNNIKSIVLLGLLIGSILFIKLIPVDITYSYALDRAHHQDITAAYIEKF